MSKQAGIISIIGLAVLALIYQSYTSHEKISSLEMSLKETTSENVVLKTQLVNQQTDVTKLKSELRSLAEPPSISEISDAIVKNSSSVLIASVANTLANNPNYRAKLRGIPGKDASEEAIAKSIMRAPKFSSHVADQIWRTRRADLVEQPALIATVAAEVHKKYGSLLKGKDGASPSASQIARYLSSDPSFAELVVFTRRHVK